MAAQAIWEEPLHVSPAPPVASTAPTEMPGAGFRFDELPPAPGALQGSDKIDDAGDSISPLLCRAWADAIVLFWENQLAAGRILADKPVYLLDLAPGDGKLAWMLLHALSARLAGSPCAALQACYLMAGTNEVALSFQDTLTQHPYLTPYVQRGCLDSACWQTGSKAGLRMEHAAIDLTVVDNPLICIAWRSFEHLPSSLYGIHQGNVLDARVHRDNEADSHHGGDGVRPLHYDWIPQASPPDAQGNLADALLAQYAVRCSDIPLTLPLAACRLLDRVAQLAGGRYLLLHAEHGICTERQLRLHACAPPAVWPAPTRLPVNVHALAWDQRRQGAASWCCQRNDDGLVLHVAWRDDGRALPHDAIQAVFAALERAHPDDGPALTAIAQSWNPTQAQALAPALLRLTHCHPALLQACIGALLAEPFVCSDSAAEEWQALLACAWEHYYPPADFDFFYGEIAILAARLGFWGLAKAGLRTGLALYGDEPGDLHRLAYCEAASGGSETALALLARARELDPAHPDCQALQQQVGERLATARAMPGYHPDLAAADGLLLEPLHPAHAESLLYQYRDPQIGVLTSLPSLSTFEEAIAWIVEQQAEQQGATHKDTYAVLHACWGFVGVVALHRHADAGYFYFWIGTDFQDRGLGPQAACLLWEQARRNGVKTVFTSVYADNGRSHHALQGLGFQPLSLRAAAPEDALIFLRKTLDDTAMNETAASQKLCALCAAIQSPFQFLTEQEDCMTPPP